jgi:hypothetical protein
MGKQSTVLLDVPDSAPQKYGRLRSDILFANHYLTSLRLYQPVEAAKESGFTRTAFADESRRAARWNVDAHIVEGDDIAEVMRDIARGERDRHCLKSDGSAPESLSPAPTS